MAVHWVLPVVAAVAAGAFAAAVLRQYARRRRPYQLAWALALAMFALASVALAVGVAAGWTPLRFKVYYLFGAILNVPWLALGTVLLLARWRAARIGYLAALILFSLASTVAIILVEVGAADLTGRAVPEGSEILPVGVRALAVAGNVVGTLVVVVGAVASGLAIRGRRDLRPRFEGNLLIAAGVLLAAAGGVFAFLSASDKLAAGLAVGATVMYAGFRRASAPLATPGQGGRRARPGRSAAPPPPLVTTTRVTLYTRVGCHLCEAAEAVLRAERAASPFLLEVVDVDTDPELVRRYGVRVPVVAVDGVEEFQYEVPADLLRARLGGGGAV